MSRGAAARLPLLRLLTGALLCCLAVLAIAGAAPALAEAPWWKIDARAVPTHLPPGGTGEIVVTAANLGNAEANEKAKGTIKVTERVPVGLTVTSVKGHQGSGEFNGHGKMTCPEGPALEAIVQNAAKANAPAEITCTFNEVLPAYEELEMLVFVKVGSLPTETLTNEAFVEGSEGDKSEARQQPLTIDPAPAPFGVERVELTPEAEGGGLDLRAGSHPYQLTTTLYFNQVIESGLTTEPRGMPPQLVKDVQTDTPPGLIGAVSATPRCSAHDFAARTAISNTNECGPETVIGVAEVEVFLPQEGQATTVRTVPVFNLVPPAGEPARFGVDVQNVPVVLDTSIETGGTYRVQVTVRESTQSAALIGAKIVLWGEPGDETHDKSRGWGCLEHLIPGIPPEDVQCPPSEKQYHAPEPFLSLPSTCNEPLETTVYADSWKEPGGRLPDGTINKEDPRWKQQRSSTPALEGCAALNFQPTLTVSPFTQAASTPTGLKVDVNVPQKETLERGKLAESTVKATTVALPVGVDLSPTEANGLQGCSLGQIGFKGVNPRTGADEFTPGPASCPDASKVASVRITSPDLPCRNTEAISCTSEERSGPGHEEHEELIGAAYIASPQNFSSELPQNPFQSLIALYIVAESPESHVRVKLAGRVSPDENSGQLVSTFENTPDVPFSHFELSFFGGPRGSVSTPAQCGSYTTSSTLAPWSGGESKSAPSSFSVTSGPGGSGCGQTFSPAFQAGASNPQAGGFSPFNVDIVRHDSDQMVQGVTTHLPPGAAALLSSVTLCPEPQASQGTCPADSLIGHTTVTSGLGPEPFTAPVGNVYITGPYKGAPFGLSIVTEAKAGPFNLGNVIVRAQILIDRNTAQVSVVSDPLPLKLRGIWLQLQHINVTVDRPGFEFNGTNCGQSAVTGTLGGAGGASEAVSYPYQLAGCSRLSFKPGLTANVDHQGSKANGVTFRVTVTSGGLGVANIQKVFLTLPKILPSRLTTIQKACTEQIFNANPATCNEASIIGKAVIHTPVLRNPLSGPAYLVSHGNAAFPDVEFLLQGEGVTLLLDGKTDIKNGITYSRFETNPDDPFTSFETELPAGPHSALTDYLPPNKNYNLCGSTLAMPTEITGQNGVVIHQNTNIAILGCGKVNSFKKESALAKALKSCRKKYAGKKHKHQRAVCEAKARKKYAPKKKSKSKKK